MKSLLTNNTLQDHEDLSNLMLQTKRNYHNVRTKYTENL